MDVLTAKQLVIAAGERLVETGLITKDEAATNIYDGSPYTADFDFAKKSRLSLLKKAFSRIDADFAQKVKDFESENKWLTQFSFFMAIKEANDFRPWWEWDEEFARYDIFKRRHRHDYAERSAFWKFCQYIFFMQWQKVKEYANSKGIKIIGDMIGYVKETTFNEIESSSSFSNPVAITVI